MKTNPLIDWYWNHGVLRKDEYALSRGHWLEEVYAIAERRAKLEALDSAEGAKKALGVWGPSQTGKSTLLSRYLDVGRTSRGSAYSSLRRTPWFQYQSMRGLVFIKG